MSEKCSVCGQELPKEPVRKMGVVKWLDVNRNNAAIEVEGNLLKVWCHECPTLKEVQISEGDRVDVTAEATSWGLKIIRITLPAQVLITAEPDPAEAGV